MADATRVIGKLCDPCEVRDVLAAGWTDKTDTSGGGQSLDYLLTLGQCFKLMDGAGKILGAYILKIDGAELWIALGAGRAEVDLTAAGLALIEAQGRQFDSIGFKTKRRGLVKKAEKHGYTVAASNDGIYTMRKKLA